MISKKIAMRQLLIAAIAGISIFVLALTSVTEVSAAEPAVALQRDDDLTEIRLLFADYAKLMNDKDTDVIAARIYDMPVIFHQSNGEHIGYTDNASFALTWKRYIDAIEAKQGAVKLDITEVSPCFLNVTTAVVTTKSIRTVLRDNSTAVSGWFYLLNRKNGQWKISEIASRDLDKSLSCP